jgi:hypothetical protein
MNKYVWKTTIRLGKREDKFLFACSDDAIEAIRIASNLVDSLSSTKMLGAKIICVERVGKLYGI